MVSGEKMWELEESTVVKQSMGRKPDGVGLTRDDAAASRDRPIRQRRHAGQFGRRCFDNQHAAVQYYWAVILVCTGHTIVYVQQQGLLLGSQLRAYRHLCAAVTSSQSIDRVD